MLYILYILYIHYKLYMQYILYILHIQYILYTLYIHYILYMASESPHFSTFDGTHFITHWSQNLPYGPRPQEQKLLFSIFAYPIIHVKSRKNEHQDLSCPK